MKRLILALPVVALGLTAAACGSTGRDAQLTDQQVCLAHNENDPAQRDRCLTDAAVRRDTPPDVSPRQLPLRTGQLGD